MKNNDFLEKNESLSFLMLDNISDAFFFLNNDLIFTYLNLKAEELLGRKKEEILHHSIYDVFGPADNTIIAQILIKALAPEDKTVENFFSPVHVRWFKIVSYASVDGFAIFFADHHEQKIAADELARRESQLQEVFNTLPHIAFMAKPNGVNTYLNNVGREYVSGAWQDEKTIDWKEIIHPEDYRRIINGWLQSKQTLSLFEGEYRLRKKKGEYRWHYGKALPIKDENGNICMWIGTATDIHKQKVAEEELLESEYFIYKLTDSTPDLISIYNIKLQRMTYVNQQIFSFLGYKLGNLNNLELSSLQTKIHPQDLPDFLKFHEDFVHASDSEIRELEYRAVDSKDNWHWLKIRGKAYQRDEHGMVSEFIATTQDITDRKESENKKGTIKHLQTLIDKKEEYISIASHELKTPITSIKASLQILKRLLGDEIDEKTLSVFISKTNQQIEKLLNLIKDLSHNTGEDDETPQLNISSFYMKDVISQCISYSGTESAPIIVRNSVSSLIQADKHKIEQVIINYITNACKYSAKGSEVFIEVHKEDNYVKVSVTDLGIGIAEDMLDKVFDRFYRVDGINTEVEGRGLGLYISAEIIKQHNGSYGVNSKLGKGSTFWFKIPLIQPQYLPN